MLDPFLKSVLAVAPVGTQEAKIVPDGTYTFIGKLFLIFFI